MDIFGSTTEGANSSSTTTNRVGGIKRRTDPIALLENNAARHVKRYYTDEPTNNRPYSPTSDKHSLCGGSDDDDKVIVVDLTSSPLSNKKNDHVDDSRKCITTKAPRHIISLLDDEEDDNEKNNKMRKRKRHEEEKNGLKKEAAIKQYKTNFSEHSIEHSTTDGKYLCKDDESNVVIFTVDDNHVNGADNDDAALSAKPAAATVAPPPTLPTINQSETSAHGHDYITSTSSSIEQRQHLTHEKKQEVFMDARRPEQLIQDELSHLYSQLKTIVSKHSPEYMVCKDQIDALHKQLHTSKVNAAHDIYNCNNSAGTMGKMDENGKLMVDFHGLYVREAIAKFDEMILPVLPVQGEVCIITGRGKHSKNGKGALRECLMDHIEQKKEEFRLRKEFCCRLGYEVDSRNDGILIVRCICT